MMQKQLDFGVLAVGMVVAAGVLGWQLSGLMVADRTVQVRGAAELPVVANLGTWSLSFSSSDNELATAQAQLSAQIGKTRAFLAKQGIAAADVELQSLSVTDAAANQYNEQRGPRFTVTGGVSVRTTQLDALQAAKNALGELVAKGVVITSAYGPNYAFTALNEAKPKLISEATAAAAKAAAQFATDSGADVGEIRRARQGSVEILGRDSYLGEAEQVNKVLRVVTTVDYALR